MTIYRDLNDVKIDLNDFEELPLTDLEQIRIIYRTKKNISSNKRKKKWPGIAMAAVGICILTITLVLNDSITANMPFVGEKIEKYINQIEELDFAPYKTSVGETEENELGVLTLNEVMMDDQQLFLSATFEPAKGVEFDYQTTLKPQVKINGEVNTVTTGSQSIELNDSMYTIYNDIQLSQPVVEELLHIEIIYDTINFDTIIESPWTFEVEASQSLLLAEKKVYELNQLILLGDDESVRVERIISTPISTTIYFDLTQSSREDIRFTIQTVDGETAATYHSSYTSTEKGETSEIRFNGFTLENIPYYVVPVDSEGKSLSEESIFIE
ncbi:DUF4179 domain-containing protein [Bacillus sp. 2205SS5-2]|uniref:DUF4179 domain-containing protein n=1 Tax=Bacillus sp. 2205SS5-2 TaxID=3109031 RepID=UPI003003C499